LKKLQNYVNNVAFLANKRRIFKYTIRRARF